MFFYMAQLFSFKQLNIVLLNLSFIFLISCLLTNLHYSNPGFPLNNSNAVSNTSKTTDDDLSCKGIQKLKDKQEKCSYAKSHEGCKPRGYIPYLQLFSCTFSPVLGYISLTIWLLLLFYLLGDTSSNYFCSSLEGLSKIMNLSPTISGITLLSLGNGAPDVFATAISFTGNGTTDLGLNSILGGAFFVTCVVVGIISISVSNQGIKISKHSFNRNVVFLFICLCSLVLVIVIGKISLWGALSFLSMYFIYVIFIFTSEACVKEEKREANVEGSLEILLLVHDEAELQVSEKKGKICICLSKILCILELPLYLPRRLTIPVVSNERWSKPIAVISVTLCPIALALTWDFNSTKSGVLVYAIVGSIGIAFGVLAFCTTESSSPPRKCLFFWLAGGFVMSISWTYILAQELISLLVSLGLLLEISHSMLGLTVLAWGNSLGDLVANMTMAMNNGPNGAQVALSGSYAGPIFNIFVGLGLSLTFAAYAAYPASYAVIVDYSVFETIGFFTVGLVWAIVNLHKRKMVLDRCLGCGLLAIYLLFLTLKLTRNIGPVGIHDDRAI